MGGERRALLVATDCYADPGLTGLRAPAGDVRALADVLADPSIGGFDVQQLVDRATDDVKHLRASARPRSSTMNVDIEQRFEGRGRITLTASTELEYAFETASAQLSVSELGVPLPRSLFTRFLVEGLVSGEADGNDDGLISIDELYDYVYAQCPRDLSAPDTR